MSDFIKNCWYVAAWDNELGSEAPLARTIIGELLALFRRRDGSVVVFEDRCPHRHAPLSRGRVEGDELRCMYHGLKFSGEGRCVHVPGSEHISARLVVRTFPVVEKWNWIWVWMGDPQAADPGLIPDAWGLDDPDWVMRESALDYAADYQLLNDNLTDLSHLDYVHEKSLGAATGARWSDEEPEIRYIDNGLHISRWLRGNLLVPGRPERVDTYSRYSYYLPGIFIQRVSAYPLGTAEASPDGTNLPEPLTERVDQQAVTPVAPGRSRYHFAHGIGARFVKPEALDKMFAVINAAFAEDKATIESQQRIWDLTDPARKKVGIPQDKAPARFRKMISDRLKAEEAGQAG